MIPITEPNHKIDYARILATIRMRTQANKRQSTSKPKPKQPRPSSFIHPLQFMTQAKISQKHCKQQPNKNFFHLQNKDRPVRSPTVIQFQRPHTALPLTHSKLLNTNIDVPHRKSQCLSLHHCVRHQKIHTLKQQKQQLINEIYNNQHKSVTRIDQDQSILHKPNAINFKTYFTLNRLMNLNEQIYHTVHYRPKSGVQRLKKTRIRC